MRKVIGIDISKAKLNYCLISNDGEILEEGHVNNNVSGMETITEILKNQKVEVIFEATGVYSRRLQYFLNLHDIAYIRMNPLKAKKEMDSLRVTKSDAIDARQLATLQMTKQYRPLVKERECYTELRHQHRFYQEITEDGAKAKNRLHKCLQDTFSEIEKLFVGDNDTLYKVIELIPHADLVKNKTVDQIVEIIQPIYGASKSRALTTARKVYNLARDTAVSVPVNSFVTNQTIHWATEILKYIKQKEKIIDEMSRCAENIEEVEILQSVPGFGRVNALCLLAELGDITKFSTPQKMNAFVGIDIRFNDSGQIKTSGFTTKRGNGLARKILFKIVLCIISTSSHGRPCNISNWYHRRSRDNIGNRKKLLVGAMDRVLRLIHHMILNREYFVYN